MRNSSPPDSPGSHSPGSRADAAFPRSPMLRRIEAEQTDRSMRRIGRIATAVAAAAVVTVGTIYSDVLKSYFGFEKGNSNSGEFLSGPCPPGDLACMDERYYEEHGFPFSHGSADGCVLLTPDEQLASPLCCPGVAVDPSACPPLDEVPSDGGDPQDNETLPGGVEEPVEQMQEPAPQPSNPELPVPPRKIDDPFGDSDVELPG